MTLSKNAIGNLLNRYKAVLKKCHMMNAFGSLAIAGMLIMGGAGFAGAASLSDAGLTSAPTALVEAGDLASGTVTFSGVTGGASTVSGGKLTLTGEADGNNNLSEGDITVSGGATLQLGNTFEQGVTVEPTNTTFGGNIDITSGKLFISDTNVTMDANKNVTIGNVGIGGLTLFDATLVTNVLEFTNTSMNIVYFGRKTDTEDYVGNLTANQLNITGTGQTSFFANQGTYTIADSVTLSGPAATQIIIGSGNAKAGNGEAHMTVTNAFTLNNDTDVSVLQGSLTVGDLVANGNNQIRIANSDAAESATLTIKTDKTYSVSEFNGEANEDNKIAVWGGGTFNIDGHLTLTDGGELALGTTVKYETDYEDPNDATKRIDVTVNKEVGAIAAKQLTLGAATTLKGGAIHLVDDGIAGNVQIMSGGALTVDYAGGIVDDQTSGSTKKIYTTGESQLIVKGGDWQATNAITISNGSLVVAAGASLDVSAGGLSVAATGKVDISDATLTASLAKMGTVDLSTGVFDLGSSIASGATITDTAASKLVLTGDATLSESIYKALLADVTSDLSTAGLFDYASISLSGFTVNADTLSGVASAWNKPTETLNAGTLNYAGTTVIAGIADAAVSTVSGSGVNLTLTGLGNTNGVLSKGDINVTGSGELTLGYNASPAQTSFQGNIAVAGGKTLTIQNTTASGSSDGTSIDKNVTLSGGADLNIYDGGLKVKDLILTGDATGNVHYIGKKNKDESYTGSIEAVTINASGANGVTILAQQGNISALNINLSGNNYTQLTVGYANATGGTASTDVNAGSITLEDGADLNVTQGTVTTNTLTASNTSRINIANSTLSTSGILNINGDHTIANATDFAASQADGKYAVYAKGQFNVAGTLTLTNGGDLTIADGGIISARDLSLGGATILKGGNLHLMAGGTGAITGELSIDNANSNVVVKGGTWTSSGLLNVFAGNLTIEAGSLTAGAEINTTGGKLTVNQGATLAMGNNALTANLADFATVDFSTGISDLSGTSVNGTLTADGNINLYLVAPQQGMLYQNEIDALHAALAAKYGDVGGVTLNGISVAMNLDALDDSTDGDKVVGAGTYTSTTHSVINGIVGDGRQNPILNSFISSNGGSLSLTGNTGNERILSVGDIAVASGTLNLGFDGAAATVGGTIKGNLSVSNGAGTGRVDIYGTSVNVTGTAKAVMDGVLEVKAGSTFTAASIEVDGSNSQFITAEDVSTQSLTLGDGDGLAIAANKTLNVASSVAIGGNLNIGDGTLEAAGFTNNTADLTISNGTLKTTAGMSNTKAVTIDGGNLEIAGGNWTAGAAVTVNSGALVLSAGTFDATQGLTVADANSLSSSANTTLIVKNDTIGSDSKGIVTAANATVTGSNGNTLLGNVTITGFDGTAENPLLLAYGSNAAPEAYNKLVTAATATYGTGGSITLVNVRANTQDTTLSQVGDNNDVTLSQNTVQAGDLAAGEVAVVGAVRENSLGVSDFTNAGGALTITGAATDGLSTTGLLAKGQVTTTAGSTTLGNSAGQSTLASKVLTDGNSATTQLINVKTSAPIESINGSTTTIASGMTQATGGVHLDASTLAIAGGAVLHTTALQGTDVAVEIGDTSGAAGLISTMTTTTGGYIKYDPPIVPGEGIDKAAYGVHGSFAASGIATTHNVLQNSIAVFGDTSTDWAIQSFNDSGLTWGNGTGEVNAALFIRAPQTLDSTTAGSTGAIEVDGSKTVGGALTAGTATFAANSLLVVDATNVGTTAAITASGGKLTVDGTAKLHIVDGADKQVLTVASGFTDTTSSVSTAGWGNGEATDALTNLSFSSSIMGLDGPAIFDAATGTYQFTLKLSFDPTLYAPFMATQTGVYLDGMVKSVGLDTDSPYAGHRFLSRALTENTYNMGAANAKQTVATIEGAAQMGAAGAVAANSFGVGQAMGGALVARNSTTGMGSNASKPVAVSMQDGQVVADAGVSAGSALQSGFGMWLMPLYKWNNVNGVDAGNLDHGYTSGLGGIALGADYTHGISKDTALRFGLAFNVGGGYSESSGDFNETNNNFDFWGLSAYAAMQKQNFLATLDLGYTSLSHSVNQEIPSSMLMSDFESDISSEIFTVGLNLEYAFVTDFMTITPHAGVRYMNVTTHGYDIESAGQTVANSDTQNQGVWYFPVGVTLSKDIATSNGWMFTPKLDVGFIAAAGELDAHTRTTFTGVGGAVNYEMQNVDGFAFNGGLGLELANEEKGISLGINYNLQASEHETGHMIFANFRYDF